MTLDFARRAGLWVLIGIISLSVSTATAQMYINEIYFDPPGSSLDLVQEYIELRGDPNASLADHYLIFLENEHSATADPGEVEYIFDLGSLSTPKLGSNGFLRLRQAGNSYSPAAPGTTDLVNTATSFTWGTTGNSTVGFSGEAGKSIIENSGFTAMLIKNNGGAASVPFVATSDPNSPRIDLDENDDNEFDPGGYLANWTVLDSIGINSEASDSNGFLYAPINFSAGSPDPNNPGVGNVSAGAKFVDVGYEIEYIARWGNSTGSDQTDWNAANLTNDGQSGFDGPADYRQSGDPHGVGTPNQFVETSQGVPYGTYMVDTPGAENEYILDGDYDPVYDGEEYVFNGVVDGDDFLAWQRNVGFGGGFYATRQHGDGNLDRTVDGADLAIWEANYGMQLPTPLTAPLARVPEPTTLLLFGLATAVLVTKRCNR
jgi:PEP-CTERM motif